MKLCLCGCTYGQHDEIVLTWGQVEWGCTNCPCPLYRASMNDEPPQEGDPEVRIADNEHMEAHYGLN